MSPPDECYRARFRRLGAEAFGSGPTRCWASVSRTFSRKKWYFRLPGRRLASSRPSLAMAITVRTLSPRSSATWAVVRIGGY